MIDSRLQVAIAVIEAFRVQLEVLDPKVGREGTDARREVCGV
jgi:hypothetical protein